MEVRYVKGMCGLKVPDAITFSAGTRGEEKRRRGKEERQQGREEK